MDDLKGTGTTRLYSGGWCFAVFNAGRERLKGVKNENN